MLNLAQLDARLRHADAALARAGWHDALVRVEEMPGPVTLENGAAVPPAAAVTELLLCAAGTAGDAPTPVALLDVKADFLPPDHGSDEARLRVRCARLHVPIAILTNGHQFMQFDIARGLSRSSRPVAELPMPGALRTQWETLRDCRLIGDASRALRVADPLGERPRRPHADAAARAILEAFTAGRRRALVLVADGTTSEGAAPLVARRLAASGLLRRVVLLVPDQARALALQIRHAGLPSLDVFGVADAPTLPADTDAVVLDDCPDELWPVLASRLARVPDALHAAVAGAAAERVRDLHAHFGEPVYRYSLAEASQDGWLAGIEVVRRDLDSADPSPDEVYRQYTLVGGPRQRGIIVCRDAAQAQAMAELFIARHARWSEGMGAPPLGGPYAAVADEPGEALVTCAPFAPLANDLADTRVVVFLGGERRASRVRRLIGRAGALAPGRGKVLLRVLDYVGIAGLLPDELRERCVHVSSATTVPPGDDANRDVVEHGVTLRRTPAGRALVRPGLPDRTAEDLARTLAPAVRRRVASLDALRAAWCSRAERTALLRALPGGEAELQAWKALSGRGDADDFDALAELGFGVRPRTRAGRADDFVVAHQAWMAGFPHEAGAVLRAMARRFASSGIAPFDDVDLLEHPDIVQAGGMRALRKAGAPAALVADVADRLLRT